MLLQHHIISFCLVYCKVLNRLPHGPLVVFWLVLICFDFHRDCNPMIYGFLPACKESHLKDFLTSAEPKTASSMKVSELSSRELRRVFFGFFRQPPGKKPDKKLYQSFSNIAFWNSTDQCSLFFGPYYINNHTDVTKIKNKTVCNYVLTYFVLAIRRCSC